ncbi:MAG: hypothetical protein MJZ16_11160 [Bacteroidales bacterium]|nr:hypothetical protein [Bacteroidales bacterium]
MALAFFSENASAQLFDFFNFGYPESRTPAPSARQTQQAPQLKFIYNTYFEYNFDNREFDISNEEHTQSMTIHGARITPEIGFQVNQNAKTKHKILLGVDIMKNMGENPTANQSQSLNTWNLFREITLYYQGETQLGKANIKGYAGVFPRRKMEGDWGEEFLSDSLKFFDNNIDGVLLKVSLPKVYLEGGIDWMGKYDLTRRERFLGFAYAEYRPTDFLSLSANFNGMHHSSSIEAPGVVDNNLLKLSATIDAAKWINMDKLSASLSYLQGYQNDREFGDGPLYPKGGQVYFEASKWHFGIDNTLYFGSSLMPLYNATDAIGNTYSTSLYLGSPLYRLDIKNDWKHAHGYDRLEVYYRPHISSFIDLNVSAVFHFVDGLSGSRQQVSLIFDLEKLYNSRKTASPSRRAQTRPKTQRVPIRPEHLKSL